MDNVEYFNIPRPKINRDGTKVAGPMVVQALHHRKHSLACIRAMAGISQLTLSLYLYSRTKRLTKPDPTTDAEIKRLWKNGWRPTHRYAYSTTHAIGIDLDKSPRAVIVEGPYWCANLPLEEQIRYCTWEKRVTQYKAWEDRTELQRHEYLIMVEQYFEPNCICRRNSRRYVEVK